MLAGLLQTRQEPKRVYRALFQTGSEETKVQELCLLTLLAKFSPAPQGLAVQSLHTPLSEFQDSNPLNIPSLELQVKAAISTPPYNTFSYVLYSFLSVYMLYI